MLEFDDKKVVATVEVPIKITEELFDDIIVTALEGGIGYWAQLDNSTDDFKAYYEDEDNCTSEIAARLLLDGRTINFTDAEADYDEIEELEEEIEDLEMGIENLSTDRAENRKQIEENLSNVLKLKSKIEQIKKDNEIETWELTFDKVLNGIKLNAIERTFDADLENMDSTTADCIIQYGLFGRVVYG